MTSHTAGRPGMKRSRSGSMTEQPFTAAPAPSSSSPCDYEHPDHDQTRKSRRRRNSKSSSRRLFCYWNASCLLLLLLLQLLSPPPAALAQSTSSMTNLYFRQCLQTLRSADANSDQVLDRTEYAQAVLELSFDKIDMFTDFGNVPPAVTDLFTSKEDATVGGIAMNDDADATTTTICDSLYTSIYQVWGVTVDAATCAGTTNQADVDYNRAISDTEYVGLVNLLMENAAEGFTFTELPVIVQTVFQDYSADTDTNEVSLADTADDDVFQRNFCSRTALAVTAAAAGADGAATIAPETEAPLITAAPTMGSRETGATSIAPTISSATTTTSAAPSMFATSASSSSASPTTASLTAAPTAATNDINSQAPVVEGDDASSAAPIVSSTTSSMAPSPLPETTSAPTANATTTTSSMAPSTGAISASPSLAPTAATLMPTTAMPVAIVTEAPTGAPTTSSPTTNAPSLAPSTTPVPVASLSPATKSCLQAIVKADVNGDENLGSDEYTIFVNLLARQTFPKAFRFLDDAVIAAYESRRDVNLIHVTGSRSNPIPADSAAALEDLCTDVWAAIQDVSGGAIVPPNSGAVGTAAEVTVAPTETPIAFDELSPATQLCVEAMQQADVNQNENLFSDEFTIFVNLLADNTLPQVFRYLDPAILAVFESHRDVTVVNVLGIGSDPIPAADATALDDFCTEVWDALATATNGAITPPVTTTPLGSLPATDPPLPVAELSPATQACVNAMKQVDVNPDESLFSDEYTNLVNVMGQDSFSTAFRYLDQSLISIFESRRDVTVIHVTGIRSDPLPAANATSLDELCTELWSAISKLTAGVIKPPTELGSDGTPVNSPAYVADLTPATISCISAIKEADTNQDENLFSDEYTNFVNILGNDTFPKAFRYLDPALTSLFEAYRDVTIIHVTGSKSDPIPASNATALEELCGAVWSAVTIASNGTIAPPTGVSGGGNLTCPEPMPMSTAEASLCNTAMVVGDVNRNDALDKFEWIRFLNRMTRNKYSSVAKFEDLPGVFQISFQTLSKGAGTVDVRGSKPNAAPTGEQLGRLQDTCSQVYSVIDCIQNANINSLGSDNLTAGEYNITAEDVRFCSVAMVISDVSRDEQIDQVEYVRLVNRLADNEFAGRLFTQLPPALQSNFVDLTDDSGLISVVGARPGASPTTDQANHLKFVCVSTLTVIASAEKGGNAENSTDSSNDYEGACRDALTIADVNRDMIMDQSEYVRFISKLLGTDPTAYDDLDAVFQESYRNISKQGDIDITGAKAGRDATTTQLQTVASICLQTEIAIQTYNSLGTNNTKELPIFNSFVITNAFGIKASDLSSGSRRQGLDEAYTGFVDDLINLLVRSRLRKRRRLRVTQLKPGSPALYQITDSECPNSVTDGSFCQTVFASFALLLESTTDNKASISQSYQALSQIAIDQGKLDSALKAIDPESQLTVVSSSSPVKPPSASEAEEAANEDKISMGAMIGIAAGVAVLVAALCIGIYVCYDLRKNRVAADVSNSGKDNVYAAPEGAYLDDDGEVDCGYDDYSDHFAAGRGDGGFLNRSAREFDPVLPFTDEPSRDQRMDSSAARLSRPNNELLYNSSDSREIGDPQSDQFDAFDKPCASPVNSKESLPSPEARAEEIPSSIDIAQAVPLSAFEQPDDGALSDSRIPPEALESEAEGMKEELIEEDEEFTEVEVLDDDDSLTTQEDIIDEEQAVIEYDMPAVAAAAAAEGAAFDTMGMSPLSSEEIADGSEDGNGSSVSSVGDESVIDNLVSEDAPVEPELKQAEAACAPNKESYNVEGEDTMTTKEAGTTNAAEETTAASAPDANDGEGESSGEEESSSGEEESSSEEEESSSEEEEDSGSEEDESGSAEEESSDGEEESDNDSDVETETTDDRIVPDAATQAAYRSRITALVQKVVPGEVENVDAMMSQFAGKEEELIQTLENMAITEESSDEDESDDEEESGDDEDGDDEDEESSEEESSEEEESDDEEENAPAPKKPAPVAKTKDASESSDDESSEDSDSS